MFTRFYALLRAFTRFYALLSQLSSLTCLRAFTRFYALLRAFMSVKQFTVYSVYSLLRSELHSFSKLHSFQGYTVFKFYPLSLRYRDPAASPLNARQYMFENQAIKLINRQLS